MTALEDLAHQESASLQARDFAAVVQVQERAAPLVVLLAGHGPAADDPALRERVAAFLSRRRKTGEWLAGQIVRAKAELDELEASRRRVTRWVPAYGRNREGSRRLHAVG